MFSEPVVEGDEQVITWLLQGEVAEELGQVSEEGALSSIFGTLRFSGEQMTVEVNSATRLEVARNYLEDVLADHLQFIDETLQPFGDLMQRRQNQSAGAQEPLLGPELQEGTREALRQYQTDYYYNNWIYQPLPSLGGLSPVEAYTRDPEKLADLLKELENSFLRSGNDDTFPEIGDLREHIAEEADREENLALEDFYHRWEEEIGQSLAEMALLRFQISEDQTLPGTETVAPNDAIIYRSGENFYFGYVDSVQGDRVLVMLINPPAHPVPRRDILAVLDEDETARMERHFEEFLSQTELTLQMAQEFNLRDETMALSTFSALVFVLFQMEDYIFHIVKEMGTKQIDFDIALHPGQGHYVMKTGILVLCVPEICAILLGIDEEFLTVQQAIASTVNDLRSRSAFLCMYYAAMVMYSLQHGRRLRNRADTRFMGLLEYLFQQKFQEVLQDISPVMDSLPDFTESNLRSLYALIKEGPGT